MSNLTKGADASSDPTELVAPLSPPEYPEPDQAVILDALPDELAGGFQRSFFGSITVKIGLSFVAMIAVVMGLILVFYTHSQSQLTLLTEIRDTRYPLQAQMQQALLQLKMVEVNMTNAVLTAEREGLDEAKEHNQLFERALSAAVEYDQSIAPAATEIRRAYQQYYDLSNGLVEALIKNPELDFFELGRVKQQRYDDLLSLLVSFEESQIRSFNDGIDALSDRASALVGMGVPLIVGFLVVGVALVVKTSHNTITRVNDIVDVARKVAIQNGDKDLRIDFSGRDEMAELAFWFNRFIDKLQAVSEKSNRAIRKLAYTDTLSGLPNRRLFNIRLEQEIGIAANTSEKIAVMFLDLDNFKVVNDQLGHEAGDILLCEVSKRLEGSLRNQDTITRLVAEQRREMVARMGGDEFMVIIPDISGAEQVEAIAERIRTEVLKPLTIEGKAIEIGVSMGIAVYPDDGQNVDQLVVNADLAMYDAKRSGKNQYCFFHQALGEQAALESEIEDRMKAVLRDDLDNELHFYFQPKFDMGSAQISGAEALIRWRSRHLGHVSPDKFIPVLETSNLILELDRLVIFSVCQQIRRWLDEGKKLVPIGINISAQQASSPSLVPVVEQALTLNQLPAEAIELEITETSALTDIEVVAQNINRLKAMSVKVALDDFGAGHASLSLMAHCSIDTLKIDREFVSPTANIDSQNPIILGIIKLAKALQVTTVGEGIETEEQYEALKEMGCDTGQGYFMAKPMPVDEFIEFINSPMQRSKIHNLS